MFSSDNRKKLFNDESYFVIKSKAVEIVKEKNGAMACYVSPVAMFGLMTTLNSVLKCMYYSFIQQYIYSKIHDLHFNDHNMSGKSFDLKLPLSDPFC